MILHTKSVGKYGTEIVLLDTESKLEYYLSNVEGLALTIYQVGIDSKGTEFIDKSTYNVWYQLKNLNHSTDSKLMWHDGLKLICQTLDEPLPPHV